MIELRVIGTVQSPLRDAALAPKQGEEGSPLADLVFDASVKDALSDVRIGDKLLCSPGWTAPIAASCGYTLAMI